MEIMEVKKRKRDFMQGKTLRFTGYIVALVAIFLFFSYQLPFYIHKPGSADALNPVVQVTDGYKSEGDMHLVTIQGGQATPFQYLLAKVRDYHEILPIEEVLPEGMSNDSYHQLQLMMMESSQEAATVVAYQAANREIDIEYEGVYVVSVLEGMPAEKILKPGDKIIEIDHDQIQEADDLIQAVTSKQPGDTIQLKIQRDGKEFNENIELVKMEELDGKPGIGIQLVTNREVTEKPAVNFSSGDIGGPSAGLMFSLEIYDQLTEEDMTHGFQIAGTGEIDYDGNVGRIGGIDKKVVAADRANSDIFFAPNENGRDNSNYQVAKKVAEEIGTDMKVVPVDHFKDAVEYLENLSN